MKKNVNFVNFVYEYYNKFSDVLNTYLNSQDIYSVFNKTNIIYNGIVDGKYEFSPLEIEIIMRNQTKILELIECVNINEPSPQGFTPLEVAISAENAKAVKLLIEKGADVNLHNMYVPLNLAVKIKNYEIVKILVENGADVNYLDKNGYNALHYLLDTGLLSLNNKRKSIFYKIGYLTLNNNTTKNICDIIELLNDKGINVNCKGKYKLGLKSIEVDVTPLTLAVERIETDVIEKLIDCGAKKEVIELNPSKIYEYQDSFNFINDIKDGDLSMWLDAPSEYINFLKYKRNILKNDIKVEVVLDQGYKRPEFIKKMQKKL